MENHFFLNAGISPPVLHSEPSSSAGMQNWTSGMGIQAMEMNCAPDQSVDCYFNPNWEKSSDYGVQFESALSSMVSSPVASNSNVSNESFVIRELIGKLGNIGNSGEISPNSQPLMASYSTNTSCYSTPLNSPPKLNLQPPADNSGEEKLLSLGKSMPINSTVADFAADPGFAERAARFSCFGSRSFNGRMSQLRPNKNETPCRSNPMMSNGKLPRVSSSPSLKAIGGVQGNRNSSPLQEAAKSQEESTVSEQNPNGGDSGIKDPNSRKRKAAASKGKGKETSLTPSPKTVSEINEVSNSKRCKQSEGENGSVKAEKDANGSNGNAAADVKPPEPPKDYIHVRARRGQATDSHSLAERVRREKISERMKLLQDLVPGCNKVTGKALMLDEIINYVQSLQRQVEFLSMKLSTVNTRLDLNIDSLMSKDIFQPNNSMPHPIFPLDSSASAFFGQQSQQNPAMHGANISNGTMRQSQPLDPMDAVLCRSLNILEQFTETLTQSPAFGEGDLQTIVQMGFAPNSNPGTPSHSQNFPGSNQVSNLKVEL